MGNALPPHPPGDAVDAVPRYGTWIETWTLVGALATLAGVLIPVTLRHGQDQPLEWIWDRLDGAHGGKLQH